MLPPSALFMIDSFPLNKADQPQGKCYKTFLVYFDELEYLSILPIDKYWNRKVPSAKEVLLMGKAQNS